MMKKRRMPLLLMLILVIGMLPRTAFAEGKDNNSVPAKRTILLYDCGADLETDAAMATYNLEQILKAHFSEDEGMRFLVMTGGSHTWQICSPLRICSRKRRMSLKGQKRY